MTTKRNQLISGVFSSAPAQSVIEFGASVHFDQRLYAQDIAGSKAHATMLSRCGILTETECVQIITGLEAIEAEIEQGHFNWSTALEDVHMNIEARLIELIGEVGKKLHTARSRNDQVATDLRLWLREQNNVLMEALQHCRHTLASKALQYADVIMPGFTHLQTAQPITFGHHLMAWQSMFERDTDRLKDAHKRINQLPLGSAALAGTTYPIDRTISAELLHFEGLCSNSLDAVSDRDFAIEFCQNAAIIMMHLSRMCEELILWNTSAFNFIELSDQFTTGSSIMPQKKNPDVAELIRGKSARVMASANSLLMLMNSQPLAYNKDNQEDKEPLFDAVDTTLQCVKLFDQQLEELKPKKALMRKACEQGFINATDLADYLVKQGISFREAHHIVGQCVQLAQTQQCSLEALPLTTLQHLAPCIKEDVYEAISLDQCVAARNHYGATAPSQVSRAAQQVLDELT